MVKKKKASPSSSRRRVPLPNAAASHFITRRPFVVGQKLLVTTAPSAKVVALLPLLASVRDLKVVVDDDGRDI